MEPLVTIMMPTKNRAQFIMDAIISMLNQSYYNWELIILDDCSTDNTETIVKSVSEFDKRVRYFRNSEPLNSIPKSRNKILELSRGDLIGHLDDDDLLREDAIEKTVSEFLLDPKIALVYSDFLVVDENKNVVHEDIGIDFDRNKLPWMGFRHFTIYKKNVAKTFGFNENVNGCEDGDLFMQIAKEFDCKHIPEFLYLYRSHRTNFGHERHKCEECNSQNMCNFFRIWNEEYRKIYCVN